MRKDKKKDEHDAYRDQARLPRSLTSSGASWRAVTPLPQIKGSALHPVTNMATVKSGKSELSMQEVQRLAQLKEKTLQRSSVHYSGSDLHVPTRPAHVHGVKPVGGKDIAELLDDESKVAEISQSRAMFNRKNGTLPGIGQSAAGALPPTCTRKLAKIAEPGVNNVLDIINKHEPNVRLKSTLREISQEYMNIAGRDLKDPCVNKAPEVILQNEARVGKAYNGLSYDKYTKKFNEETSRSRSRAESRASRKSK